MSTPLDPAIAQIIPLLPLRDPDTMTPRSTRDALRALVAVRADIPLPQVQIIEEMEVMGADVRLHARVYRVSREKSPTAVFFHGGGWVAGDQGPDTEAQDQSPPLCRFSLQRTAGPYSRASKRLMHRSKWRSHSMTASGRASREAGMLV